MELAILTSSRADFGFYKPLIYLLQKQTKIKINLIAFGTHLSKKHGYTINDIKNCGFEVSYEVDLIPDGDSPTDIANTIGIAHQKFSELWANNNFDLILCIGDRFEMFAAVSASVPFGIPVAHISGGEETLGAIDNVYRHTMSLMSKYHFTNTKKNSDRVKQITGQSDNVFNTGSLAIDNINETQLFDANEFENEFRFDITNPFILFTFHPETVDYKNNFDYTIVLKQILLETDKCVLVTMPNADTMGDFIRKELIDASNINKNIYIVESLGSKGYYTALKNCDFVLGNSSSGIIEAASFAKYVINLGQRQLGREFSSNVLHCNIDKIEILKTIASIENLPQLGTQNIYGDGNAANNILAVLNDIAINKKIDLKATY